MTSSSAPTARLWTPAGFRDDDWVHGETAEALASNQRVILPLGEFRALDEATRLSAKDRLGVLVAPGESLDEIEPHLANLPLVALSFPAFNDGRSFSKAQLLRSRHSYEGAVRATGQVLVDQLPHMLRVGFDEFEISNPVLIARLEAGRIGGIEQQYQPAAKPSSDGAGYSWRRTRTPGASD